MMMVESVIVKTSMHLRRAGWMNERMDVSLSYSYRL